MRCEQVALQDDLVSTVLVCWIHVETFDHDSLMVFLLIAKPVNALMQWLPVG